MEVAKFFPNIIWRVSKNQIDRFVCNFIQCIEAVGKVYFGGIFFKKFHFFPVVYREIYL